MAKAFIVGTKFIGSYKAALILGDIIFYSSGLSVLLQANNNLEGGIVYGYHLKDTKRYGVVDFDSKGNATSIKKKPLSPKSNYTVPGIYFYDNQVIEIAKIIMPS